MATSVRRVQDTTPHIRPAGRSSRAPEGAADCIQPDTLTRPQTPPEIKKYRKSTLHEPGRIVRHYGLAEDKIQHDENKAFGIKKEKRPDDTVAAVIKVSPESGMMAWLQDRKEEVYASSKREPLGKSMVRGYTLPPDMGTQKPFGTFINAKTRDKAPEAMSVIFQRDANFTGEDPAVHSTYVKTHGDYAPGEQRRRGYDWSRTSIDPDRFTFGVKLNDPSNAGGVASALNPQLQEDQKASTNIVSKRVEDFKMTDADELGRPKPLGLGIKHNEEHVCGIPTIRGLEPTARDVIFGGYSEEEQQPDADLGRSVRRGYGNPAEDSNRVFGVPTIRKDVKHGSLKSVANSQNYGDEPDAWKLLRPLPFADRGVSEEDYLQMLTRPEMAELMSKAGIYLEGDAFEELFERALELDSQNLNLRQGHASGGGLKCTVDAFRCALHNSRR